MRLKVISWKRKLLFKNKKKNFNEMFVKQILEKYGNVSQH